MVTIMQFVENLTDRQAADAVQGRIDWKYGLSDAGFDFSILSGFRSRLLSQGAEGRLFEIELVGFQERELLKARGKQRSDSTHILTPVRELNRLEFVGETLLAALNQLASVAPDWLKAVVWPHWFALYSRPFSSYRLPTKQGERLALGEQIGRNGMLLLNVIYGSSSPTELRQLAQVEFLRRPGCFSFTKKITIFTGMEVAICHGASTFSSRSTTRMRGAVTKVTSLGSATKSTRPKAAMQIDPTLLTMSKPLWQPRLTIQLWKRFMPRLSKRTSFATSSMRWMRLCLRSHPRCQPSPLWH